MAFENDLNRFIGKVATQSRAHFVGVVAAMESSIKNGSALTGAPGQPVVTGNLIRGWQVVFENPLSAVIGTNVPYASVIEFNTRGARIPAGPPKGSTVGGAHSVALTIAALDKIVASEAEKLKNGAGGVP